MHDPTAWQRLLTSLTDAGAPPPEPAPPWRSVLSTDAYKFSMMLGGRPAEQEAFYLSFRRGGRLFVPVDVAALVRDLIPQADPAADAAYLAAAGFPVPAADLAAVTDQSAVEVVFAVPRGETCDPREPLVTLRGPQALVSWLEPLLIGRLSYQAQVATEARTAVRAGGETLSAFLARIAVVTCEEQRRLTLEALEGSEVGDALGVDPAAWVRVDTASYATGVAARCQRLLDTGVHPDRFFEVGLRAATCMEQHLVALATLRRMGFTRTSNVYGARLLGMVPVGTLGHEGIGRWGGDDELCFRKHLAALPRVTFLLDTTDTMKVGLPLAFRLFAEHPDRLDGARPDSGDLTAQFRAFVEGVRARGISPRPWVFEDGLDDRSVARFEALRRELAWPEARTLFGLGGYFVDRAEPTGLGRGRVNMIYKLSWSSRYGATMKFANEAEAGDSGKQSLPGVPVTAVNPTGEPRFLVCQADALPPGYRPLQPGDSALRDPQVPSRPALCPTTRALVDRCTEARRAAIARATPSN